MLSVDAMKLVATGIVSDIEWYSPIAGFCQCPGEALHANLTGRRDCRIVLSAEAPGKPEAPTVSCFHRHCADAVAAANHRLRSEIGKAKARLSAGMSASPGGARTARTADFTISNDSEAVSRTARTVILKPLRTHTRAHTSSPGSDVLPSEPSAPYQRDPGDAEGDLTHCENGVALRLRERGRELPEPRVISARSPGGAR